MLELRERADKRSCSPSLPTISSLHGTIEFMEQTIRDDFAEPLYGPHEDSQLEEREREEIELEE